MLHSVQLATSATVLKPYVLVFAFSLDDFNDMKRRNYCMGNNLSTSILFPRHLHTGEYTPYLLHGFDITQDVAVCQLCVRS